MFQTGKDELKTCIEGQINATVFKDELEAAKKTGSMDEVFGKYCAKTPTIKKCVGKFTDTLRECLDTNERNTLNTTLDVLKKLGEFVCYNDGDRLASKVGELSHVGHKVIIIFYSVYRRKWSGVFTVTAR